MRLLPPSLTACFVLGCLVTSACAKSELISAIPARPATSSGMVDTQALAGLWRLAIDPATLDVQLTSEPIRTASDNDDLYLLSTNRFFTGGVIQITDVRTTATTLDIDYQVTHPIPAPSDPTAPPSAGNRADLGIAGRVAFLVEVPTATGNTYFSDRVVNTSLIVNPDHYYAPAGLLAELHLPANTFPCQTLVDELDGGSRKGIDNGGSPSGNFGADGWTRAEFGASNDGWTGYGVLHQGQTSARSVSIDLAALSAIGTLDLNVALLVRYNDPRGGADSDEKRANRLPPATPEYTRFAYRMPHGALDGAPIAFTSESGTFEADLASSSTLGFTVIDWDARASETSKANLFDDGDVTTVAVGESGAPALAVCIPGVLGDGAVVDLWDAATLTDDDTAIGGDPAIDSGLPGDALYYSKLVTKSAATGQTGGTYTGMVRITDPEAALVAPLALPLDPATLAPLTLELPESVTYQAFTVVQQPGPTGIPGWVATFGDAEDIRTVTVDGGADGHTAIGSSVRNLTLDPRHLFAARFDANGSMNWEWLYTADAGSNYVEGVAIDPTGNAYVAGFFQDPIDFGQGLVNPVGTTDCFVLKLDPTGDTIWLRTFGSPAVPTSGHDLALDSLGRVLVVGRFEGTVNFGGVPRSAGGNPDTFVLQLSSGGIYQWDRTLSNGGGDNYGEVVATGPNDALLVSGIYRGDLDFGGGVRNSIDNGFDGYAMRLSQAGAYQWDFTWGPFGAGRIEDAAVHLVDGRIFIGGGSLTGLFGESSEGGYDGFLMCLTGEGTLDWIRMVGGPDLDLIQGVALNPTGRLYVSGIFENSCVPCNGGVPAAGVFDAFFQRLTLDGETVWRRGLTGEGYNDASDIDVDGDGDLRIVGRFDDTCDFDPGPGVLNRTATTLADGFILRLSGSTGYL